MDKRYDLQVNGADASAAKVGGVLAAGVGVLGAVLAGGSLVAGAMAAPASALADEAPLAPAAAQATAASGTALGAYEEVSHVSGTFAFTQDAVTPTAQIARAMRGADKVLCSGSEGQSTAAEEVAADAGSWVVSVGGNAVDSAFSATMDDLAKAGTQTRILGCTCLGNPADGRASVNAQCTGVSVSSLLELAGAHADANVITFVSSDGYEVSLPLTYVAQRASMLVYQVNGQPLADSMGGTNQLWLGATAARYFTRDVCEIRVDKVDEADVPAAPGTPEAGDVYANRPNVGVLASS